MALLQNVDRDLLFGGMQQMKNRFDDALDRMRTEKIDLAISVKAAEVQVIVLLQEHSLLVDFSSKDNVLAKKLSDKHAEQKVNLLTLMPAFVHHLQAMHREFDMKRTWTD